MRHQSYFTPSCNFTFQNVPTILVQCKVHARQTPHTFLPYGMRESLWALLTFFHFKVKICSCHTRETPLSVVENSSIYPSYRRLNLSSSQTAFIFFTLTSFQMYIHMHSTDAGSMFDNYLETNLGSNLNPIDLIMPMVLLRPLI